MFLLSASTIALADADYDVVDAYVDVYSAFATGGTNKKREREEIYIYIYG